MIKLTIKMNLISILLSLIINLQFKNDDKYAYHFANVTRYSQQIVEFIVKEIKTILM